MAVVNDSLKHNHQSEIVEKLCAEGYILGFASVEELKASTPRIKEYLKNGPTKTYQRPKESLLNKLIFGNHDRKLA